MRKVAFEGLASERKRGWPSDWVNLPFQQMGCEKVQYKIFHAEPKQ